ncbi:MAG: hypothetical protein HYT27_00970 [Parcubacteria group bacterium]|nr:hypothetical protein [Parcubacteria group bacterium]
MTIVKLLTNRNFYSVALAVVVSFVLVAIMVSAATTISTNISTGGTLSVTGNSTLTGDVFATSTLAVTGKAVFYDQLALDSAASDPTGVTAGSLYWNTADSLIRVFDGADWRTVASSTSGDGGLILSNDVAVRFNTIATGNMALGTSTLPVVSASGNSLLFLNATTSATIPLVIQGWADQTGDLVRGLSDLNVELFAIDHSGNASTTLLSTTGIHVDALVISGYATTSGSTGNFATEGTVTVTGATTLNGAVTLGDAVGDAITITGNASTTNSLTVVGLEFSVGGFATTTIDRSDTFATTTIGVNTEAGGGGALGVGTTTPGTGSSKFGVEGDVWVGSTATTSLVLHTNAATTGTCWQFVASDGTLLRMYATSTPGNMASGTHFPFIVEAGSCK